MTMNDTQRIYLAERYYLVDTQDAAYLSQFKWYSSKIHTFPFRYNNKYGEEVHILSITDDIYSRELGRKLTECEFTTVSKYNTKRVNFTRKNIVLCTNNTPINSPGKYVNPQPRDECNDIPEKRIRLSKRLSDYK